jgi:hypothetical protein
LIARDRAAHRADRPAVPHADPHADPHDDRAARGHAVAVARFLQIPIPV